MCFLSFHSTLQQTQTSISFQTLCLIGYGIFQKGYRYLDLSSNKIFVSRSVQFDEQQYPFKDLSQQTIASASQSLFLALGPIPLPLLSNSINHGPNLPQSYGLTSPSSSRPPISPAPQRVPDSTQPSPDLPHMPDPPQSSTHNPQHLLNSPSQPSVELSPLFNLPPPLLDAHPLASDHYSQPSDFHNSLEPLLMLTGSQPVHPSSSLDPSGSIDALIPISSSSSDHSPHCIIPQQQTAPLLTPYQEVLVPTPFTPSLNSHSMITRTKNKTHQPKQFPQFIAHHARPEIEPNSFNQANKSQNWRDAMFDEFNALASNNT